MALQKVIETNVKDYERRYPYLLTLEVKQWLKQPGFYLRSFNLVFYSILLAVMMQSLYTQNRPAVGAVYGVDGVVAGVPQPDGSIVGTFGDLGHPIILNGVACTYDVMWSCVNEGTTGVCCDELKNPNSIGPESSVDSDMLELVGIAIPYIFICLRIALMGYLSWKYGTEKWRAFSGFYSVDSFIGFGATVIFYWYAVAFTKYYVGCARPNFYALRFWIENAKADTFSIDKSYASWASGHSCMSMAAGVFLALLIKSDIRAAHSLVTQPIAKAVLQSVGHLICMAIIYGYAFVGFSRIREYWHYTVDVISGWAIGALAAYLTFTYVTKGPYELNMADERMKRSDSCKL